MGRFRINYFDVVARAGTPTNSDVARAVEAISRTYRAGRSDLDYDRPDRRAAYLWHCLPAHVCDVARIVENIPALVADRTTLRVVSLGAGPGSDVLGLLEACSDMRARGGLEQLALVEATRLDLTQAWDDTFGGVYEAAYAQLRDRCPDLGTAWDVAVDARSEAVDVTRGLGAGSARDQLAAADLVTCVNLLSEIAPRETDALPLGAQATFEELIRLLRPGADLLLVDRSGSPGLRSRMAQVVEQARALRVPAIVQGPRDRKSRCACVVTRGVQQLYRGVRIPGTRTEARPIRNCKTTWARVRF